MENQLKEAIEDLTKKAKATGNASEAMHFTQAALNATHALMTLKQIEKQ